MDGFVYHSVEEVPDCILNFADAFLEDPETHEIVLLYEESDPDSDLETLPTN